MDYEKKYNEALERLRAFYLDYDNISHLVDVKEELESIFSELRESEDERIRMALCDIVRDMPYMQTELRAHGLTVEKTITYLEKQKEPSWKPSE